VTATSEISATFPCFGGRCEVRVDGDAAGRSAREAVELAHSLLLRWDAAFSRFDADSELSRLNVDPRERVPVSPMMARFARAVVLAGLRTHGLVDATLLAAIERAGYSGDQGAALDLRDALAIAPERQAAAPAPSSDWRRIDVDLNGPTVIRPPGVMLDSGGIAKGLFADALAELLAEHASFAVNCAGDLAVGGTVGVTRPIDVESPFDGSTLHTFRLPRSGVATSGIGRRSWLGADGRPAHHLLDPATGRPAYTGIVQVTALAPSALEAEVRAKAALLSGPGAAIRWLTDGGVIVFDDGGHEALEPPPTMAQRRREDSEQPHDEVRLRAR
jgi:FAD:protein FMN transferase